MHANPVERRLVTHPKDWPWSSWSHYVKGELGLIRIDVLEEQRTANPPANSKKTKSTPAPLTAKGAAPHRSSAARF